MELLLAVVAALITLWIVLLVALWVARPRNVALREVARVVPDVLRLVRSLVADRAAPASVRLALVALLAWLISPIDLVPEFIPVLGPLDDAVVTVLVLRFVRRRLGDAELRRRWSGSQDSFDVLTRLLGGPAVVSGR